MLYSALTLALVGAAAASPVQPRAVPQVELQRGYNLIVNVTDLSRDFQRHPVHGSFVNEFHLGNGIYALIADTLFSAPPSTALFYSTASTIQATLSGTEPHGLVQGPSDIPHHGLSFNINDATKGFGPSQTAPLSARDLDESCAKIHAPNYARFAVCDNGFDVNHHPRYTVELFEQVPDIGDGVIPHNCVPVNLLPECAHLDLSEATYPVDNMVQSLCYKDKVKSIQWSQWPQCY